MEDIHRTPHAAEKPIGRGDLDSSTVTSVEKFICRIYSVTDVESCNEARATLFSRCRSPEALPPTSDEVRWHIQRAHYKAKIWKNAHVPHLTLPLPGSSGWTRLNGKLMPKLMSLALVPQSCDEMVKCSCKSGCNSRKCSCRSVGLPCTGACKCRRTTDSRYQNNASTNGNQEG